MDVANREPARAWAVLAAVLVAVGVGLRLAHPEHVSFGGEQVEAITLALRSWNEGGIDRGLRVSTGVDMPPMYPWILSLPVALSQDPVRITQFVMLLNLAGLAGLFFMVRARRSSLEAWLVTALCATAPWSIVFARKIWAQDVLFPFQIAFCAVFLSMLAKPAPWKTWTALFVLGILTQIYPSAWFLLPPILIAAWILRVRVRVRDIVIGAALVLALWWPHLRYQYVVELDDWRQAWATTFGAPDAANVVRNAATEGGGGPGRGWWLQMLGTWQRAGGGGLDLLLDRASFEAWQRSAVVRIVGVCASAFVLVAACATAWGLASFVRAAVARVRGASTRPERTAPAATTLVESGARSGIVVLFAAIVVLVPIEYALLGLPALPHYQMIVQPGVAVLVGVLASASWRRFGCPVTWIAPTLILAFAALHATQWAQLQAYVVEHAESIGGAHGPIYSGARTTLDHELESALDDMLQGDARRAAEDQRIAELFARATDVMWQDAPPAHLVPVGGVTIEAGPDGARVVLQYPPAFVDLTPLARRANGFVIVRLDVTSPIDAYWTLFFQTVTQPDYRRTQAVTQKLQRGRSFRYVMLEAAPLQGPMRLRFGPARFVIHGIEVRAFSE